MPSRNCPHCGTETAPYDFSAFSINGKAVHGRCFPAYLKRSSERGARIAVSELLRRAVLKKDLRTFPTIAKVLVAVFLGKVSSDFPRQPYERIGFGSGKSIYVRKGISNWGVASDAEWGE